MGEFHVRLKQCRKQNKQRQEDTAKALEIAYSTYRRYEQGGTEPTLSDAAKIADHFHVSLDYLAGRTDDPTPPSQQ